MLKVCDGCKNGLDTGHPLAQNGAENGAVLAPFRANGAHPSIRQSHNPLLRMRARGNYTTLQKRGAKN